MRKSGSCRGARVQLVLLCAVVDAVRLQPGVNFPEPGRVNAEVADSMQEIRRRMEAVGLSMDENGLPVDISNGRPKPKKRSPRPPPQNAGPDVPNPNLPKLNAALITKVWRALSLGRGDDGVALEVVVRVNPGAQNAAKGSITALMSAAYANLTGCVGVLVRHGADLDRKNELGETALSMAAENGYDQVVQQLLDAGATPTRGALHQAIVQNHTRVARTIIDHGDDFSQDFALHTAVLHQRVEIVRALLSAGADAAAKQPDEQDPNLLLTPLELARMLHEGSFEASLPDMEAIERLLSDHVEQQRLRSSGTTTLGYQNDEL